MRKLTIVFTFLFLLFFFSFRGITHAYRIADCTITSENACDILNVEFRTNNTGTTFEVRYKYVYTTTSSNVPRESPSVSFSVMVDNGTTRVQGATAPTGYDNYKIHWATTCVDPFAKPYDSFDSALDGIGRIYYWNINIDPRDQPQSYKPLGNGQNLGTVGWTGSNTGFVAGSTSRCYPPPPTYRVQGFVFVDENSNGTYQSGPDRCFQNSFGLTGLRNDNFTARGCGNGNDPWFVINTTTRNGTVCLNVPNNYKMATGNTRCRDTTGDTTIRFGIVPDDGPISGNIILPGGNNYTAGAFVLRKSGANWDEDIKVRSGNNGGYSFPGLSGGSSHDIALARKGDSFSFANSNKVDSCVYVPESSDASPWVKDNIQAPNSNVDFKLKYETYAIRGKLWWDPDGSDGGNDRRPYVNQLPGIPGKDVRVRVSYNGNAVDSDLVDGSLSPGNANAGEFGIGGLNTDSVGGKTYTVTVDTTGQDGIRPAHKVLGGNSRTVNITCGDMNNIDFNIGPDEALFDISGIISEDTTGDGTGDQRYQGNAANRARIEIVSTNRFALANNTNGTYTITGNPGNNNYNIQLIANSLRPGYRIVSPGTVARRVNSANETGVNFVVRRDPAAGYSISGGLFIDTGSIGSRDSEPYTNPLGQESITINSTGTTPNYSRTLRAGQGLSNSGFSVGGLAAGTYTISFPRANVRNGYVVSYPSSATYRNITIGPDCQPASNCLDGDGEDYDFGISNNPVSNTWIQSVGGDVRWDRDTFTNVVPNNATCSDTTQPYVSAPSTGAPYTYSSGLVFTGNSPRLDSGNNNNSKANSQGWLITNAPFSPSKPGTTKTSYDYIMASVARGRVTSQTFQSACTNPSAACRLRQDLQNGVYISSNNNSITLAGDYNFSGNRDFVFLIKGNLNITGNITVDPGSTAYFIVGGNITVDANVNSIQGIYSANQDIILASESPDTSLTVEGNLIANANLQGGNIVRSRTLGSQNDTCPAVKVITRPDFILNGPELIRSQNIVVQEVAPGPIESGRGFEGGEPPLIAIDQSCTPKTDRQLCDERGKVCGPFTVTDCGISRDIASCGECTGDTTCGGGGVDNQCGTGCVPWTDAEFCSERRFCGQNVSGTDNCSQPRTNISCGNTCTGGKVCGAENKCIRTEEDPDPPKPLCESGNINKCLKNDFNVFLTGPHSDAETNQIFRILSEAGQSWKYKSLLKSSGPTEFHFVNEGTLGGCPSRVTSNGNGTSDLELKNFGLRCDYDMKRSRIIHETGHIIRNGHINLYQRFMNYAYHPKDKICYSYYAGGSDSKQFLNTYDVSYAISEGISPSGANESLAELISQTVVPEGNYPRKCDVGYAWVKDNVYNNFNFN